MFNFTEHKQWNYLHSQQPLHGFLLPVLLSELVQRAVMPTQRSKHHLFSFLLHTPVEQRLCRHIKLGRRRKSAELKLRNSVCCLIKSRRKCSAPTLDEGITYDDVLSSILRHKKFS